MPEADASRRIHDRKHLDFQQMTPWTYRDDDRRTLTSPPTARDRRRKLVLRVARRPVSSRCSSSPPLLGTVSGVLFAYAGDLPEISALDDYQPQHHHAPAGARRPA